MPGLRPSRTTRIIFFFCNDTATTEIYTLSLHDALPISSPAPRGKPMIFASCAFARTPATRSEEHTSELQSRGDIVCRLLLAKKKNIQTLCMCWECVTSKTAWCCVHFAH